MNIRKPVAYHIATGPDVYLLTSHVNGMIHHGWEPVGGICHAGNVLMQSLVLYETVDKQQAQ